MRHHDKNKKFGRERNQRKALMRSLAVSLIQKGKMRTTEAKAKAIRPFVEKLVSKGRVGGVAVQRLVAERLGNVLAARRMIHTIAPQYKSRTGGYTRIIKLPRRIGDGSPMALIEFVVETKESKPEKAKKK